MKAKELGILVVKIVVLAVVLMVISGVGSSFLPGPEADVAGQVAETVGETAPAPPSGSFMAIVFFVLLLQTGATRSPRELKLVPLSRVAPMLGAAGSVGLVACLGEPFIKERAREDTSGTHKAGKQTHLQ